MLVLVLIALNGVFVAGEFALVAVDGSRIDVMAEGGHPTARLVRGLLRRLSFHLGGAQLGITVTSLLLGLIAEDALGALLHTVAGVETEGGALTAIVAIVVATIAQMVFGEMAPKNLAISRPLGVSLGLAPILRLYGLVAAPLILLFNGLANRTVRWFGIEPTEELKVVRSLDELEYVVATSRERTLDEADARLLTRTLRLSRKDAADALTPRTALVVIPSGGTVADLVAAAIETGHSRFPVVGDDLDDVVGVVEVRDVFDLEPDERTDTPISALLKPALVVPEQRELDGVLVDLEAASSRIAVVVDEHGGTAGIITREDILEELVGDIADEYDDPVPLTVKWSGDRYVFDGRTNLDELDDRLGLVLPDGPYETLAGFLLQQFGSIPDTGAVLDHDGWRFEVTGRDRLRVAEVAIRPPMPDEDPAAPKSSASKPGDVA